MCAEAWALSTPARLDFREALGAMANTAVIERYNQDLKGKRCLDAHSVNSVQGELWYKVGTNQWVAWVRADFVCRPAD